MYNSQTINPYSCHELNSYLDLAQSPDPYHRTVFVALQTLKYLDNVSQNGANFNAVLFWENCNSLDDDHKNLALKIISIGLEKYRYLSLLNRATEWTQRYDQIISNRLWELGDDNMRISFISTLEGFINQLRKNQPSHITDYCIRCLQKIHGEWGGLHITPEQVVHACQLQNDGNKLLHIQSIANRLVKIRELITQMQTFDHYEAKDTAIQNLKNILYQLRDYFAMECAQLTPKEIEELDLPAPEKLELYWIGLNQLKNANRDIISNLQLREIGLPSALSSWNLKLVNFYLNHERQLDYLDLREWVSSGYEMPPEKLTEIGKYNMEFEMNAEGDY